MDLTPGYKWTEVGVVPDDWEVRPLGLAAETSSGTTPSRSLHDRYYAKGSIHWVKTLDLNNGYLDATEERVTEQAVAETSLRVYPPGTVLVAMYGGFNQIGRTGLLKVPAAVNQALTAIRPIGTLLAPGYLLAFLNLRVAYWKTVASSSRKDANITGGDVRSFPVSLPPLPEQQAIAAALSDVDALLGALDRLIAKKRDLKQAAMQQLLTGQTRLPGFSGKWEETTLGALGSWFSGGTPSKGNENYWTGEIPWVSPKDMKVARILDAIDHVGQTAIGNGTRLLPVGAILIVVRGMILAHSAPVARVERPVAFNQDIKGLVVRSDIDSNFVLWWLVAHEVLLLSLTNEATHGTKRIPTDELLKLKLRVPGLNEQAAVAGAVTDMDAELSALEQRRDKTRLLKQGMMQELLTGRTRLV